MTDRAELLQNESRLHTTPLGFTRIQRNLGIEAENVVELCRAAIRNVNSNVFRRGKNYYCELDRVRWTINAKSFTIITAHRI